MISGFRPTRGGSDSEKEKKKDFWSAKALIGTSKYACSSSFGR